MFPLCATVKYNKWNQNGKNRLQNLSNFRFASLWARLTNNNPLIITIWGALTYSGPGNTFPISRQKKKKKKRENGCEVNLSALCCNFWLIQFVFPQTSSSQGWMSRWQSRSGNTCVSRNPGDGTPPFAIWHLSRTWLRFPSLGACNYLTFHNSYKLIMQYSDKYLLTRHTHTHTRSQLCNQRIGGRMGGCRMVVGWCRSMVLDNNSKCNNIVDLFLLVSGENYFITAKLADWNAAAGSGKIPGGMERLQNNWK